MSHPKTTPTRRRFLQQTGGVAAATTLLTAAGASAVHAQDDGVIQVALVGCGGRGTGAAMQALSVKNGPTKLVAMADAFQDRLNISYRSLSTQKLKQVDVPDDRKFVGFDAYKKAIDCLRPGDVVIFATPPAFRWLHFTYAIEKGVNVFMEKPVTIDGPTSKRMFELAKKADAKNLKVGVGLMCRHCKARNALADRIHDGQLGDILTLRAYRMAGPTGSAATGKPPKGMSDLEWQIRRFHAFLWASGGAVSDFLIHNIDEGCWAKGEWPIKAIASGGRHYRAGKVDQNFDTYSIEFTFADGTKLLVDGRTIPGCKNDFATYVHGTKGGAIFSTAGHVPARSRIYKGQNFEEKDLVWSYPDREPNPYQVEWDDLINAIKDDQKYSEVERGVKSSLVTSMGRMAAHTGQEITYDAILNCDHEFAPELAKLSFDGPPPVQPDGEGNYPVPMPGLVVDYEYEA
ncbi:MAG: Gfo/Idh/MocA family oxidoreductase [Pirellulaceae bacterium]|nr:Gfo/Idh/MocA family oxidoreductase [Pirellulaceae bacterium]